MFYLNPRKLGMHTLYQNTSFLTSATALEGMPEDSVYEVAFAGRSNAGKSSAINQICHQRALARTSKTPGRTQQINFFKVTLGHYLVDLPGYGFARAPGGLQREWGIFIARYLQHRRSLAGLIILMDIRHPFTILDIQLLDLCRESCIATYILLTKADKISRSAGNKTLNKVQTIIRDRKYPAAAQCFSATRGTGLETAQCKLDEWLMVAPQPSSPGRPSS